MDSYTITCNFNNTNNYDNLKCFKYKPSVFVKKHYQNTFGTIIKKKYYDKYKYNALLKLLLCYDEYGYKSNPFEYNKYDHITIINIHDKQYVLLNEFKYLQERLGNKLNTKFDDVHLKSLNKLPKDVNQLSFKFNDKTINVKSVKVYNNDYYYDYDSFIKLIEEYNKDEKHDFELSTVRYTLIDKVKYVNQIDFCIACILYSKYAS